ncbi:MAG: GTPase ObgE [Candidatus Sumerlaeaceae bacterium]|nr:GTPase ObgE [Candidatus Sumerlaeaceae bacterium]
MFVDYAKVSVKAGDGGDGCISFLREKYIPHGGPNGGDGGRGGSIIFVADELLATLLDLKHRAHYTTKRGQHGGGKNCSGKDAEDLYVKVPLGTTISTEDGELIADLTVPGQEVVVAKGGRGGRGNQHFASATNKAPRKFEYGEEGEQRTLILELKVIAEVGLVGLPNAGKSTLLSKLTAATPKIASYPFTTIHPNLGVLEFADGTRCTIADIPGLIEGAHTGAGLGDRFLRHIERTKLLVHLVAPAETEPNADVETMKYAFDLVNNELASYSADLAGKAQIVCLTKTDMLTEEEAEEVVTEFRKSGIEMTPICSHTEAGFDWLRARIQEELAQLVEPEPPEAPEPELPGAPY